eukprot:11271067-Alexandrium_andersonii.AAC.1
MTVFLFIFSIIIIIIITITIIIIIASTRSCNTCAKLAPHLARIQRLGILRGGSRLALSADSDAERAARFLG